jgi:hypothetical protein
MRDRSVRYSNVFLTRTLLRASPDPVHGSFLLDACEQIRPTLKGAVVVFSG